MPEDKKPPRNISENIPNMAPTIGESIKPAEDKEVTELKQVLDEVIERSNELHDKRQKTQEDQVQLEELKKKISELEDKIEGLETKAFLAEYDRKEKTKNVSTQSQEESRKREISRFEGNLIGTEMRMNDLEYQPKRTKEERAELANLKKRSVQLRKDLKGLGVEVAPRTNIKNRKRVMRNAIINAQKAENKRLALDRQREKARQKIQALKDKKEIKAYNKRLTPEQRALNKAYYKESKVNNKTEEKVTQKAENKKLALGKQQEKAKQQMIVKGNNKVAEKQLTIQRLKKTIAVGVVKKVEQKIEKGKQSLKDKKEMRAYNKRLTPGQRAANKAYDKQSKAINKAEKKEERQQQKQQKQEIKKQNASTKQTTAQKIFTKYPAMKSMAQKLQSIKIAKMDPKERPSPGTIPGKAIKSSKDIIR